jgi:hypothetical protein
MPTPPADKLRQTQKSNPRRDNIVWIVNWLLNIPRVVRILIVGIFAVSVTLGLFQFVDFIYLRLFFTMETRIIPSLVSASFGLAMYLLGWMCFVGTAGEKPPVRRAVLWYFGTGIFAVFLVLLWMLEGYFTGNAPI